ncbi:MAG: methyltransferase domain-containing protein [Bacteroidota bacterium]
MEQIEFFEDKRASKYDQFVNQWIPGYQYFMQLLPKLLLDKMNQPVLIAGCGTGSEMLELVKHYPHCDLIGVDPSPEMVSQAKDRLKTFSNVKVIEGTVNTLAKDSSFGSATLILVLHFMEDDGTKLDMLRSIADRLKSGSSFVILDITGTREELERNLDVLEMQLDPKLDPEEIKMRRNRIKDKLHVVSADRLEALLEEAGFGDVNRFYQNSIYMGWMAKKV